MTKERTPIESIPIPFVRRKTDGRATVNYDLIEKILQCSQFKDGICALTDMCVIPISFPKSKKGWMNNGFTMYSVTDEGLLEEIVFYIHVLNASGLIVGGEISRCGVNGKISPFCDARGYSQMKLTKEGERFLELLRFFRGCAVSGETAIEKFQSIRGASHEQ